VKPDGSEKLIKEVTPFPSQRTLDRSRNYGQSEHEGKGAWFTQDGGYFDMRSGEEIFPFD
jgi:hypothetical protein